MTTNLLDRPTLMPDVLDDLTRREFITGLAAAGLLAACGGGNRGTDASPADTMTTWDRGPFGPVQVPKSPKRVIVGNSIDADYALVLGLPLVGVPGTLGNASLPFAQYHADRLAGVERVQTGGEPNLEQVLAARPDLIIDSWDAERPRYDGFSGVAPTVNLTSVMYPNDFSRGDWQAALTELGRLFGLSDRAEEALGAYRSVISEGRSALQGVQGKTFAGVNVIGAEGIVVIDEGQLISQVSSDLGLTPYKLVGKTPADRTALSLEELGQLEGVDYIMFAEYPSEESLERETERSGLLYSNPVWQQLSAVREGRVVGYPGEIYYVSPLTAVALANHLVTKLSA
jgi:iron complex transport system substrate-binding protein